MERVKTISRNKSGLAEADSYRPELLTDEEPRYLRRQRPVEIRRKKFAGRGWSFYRKVAILSVAGIASVTVVIEGVRFLLYSPQFALAKARSDRSYRQQNRFARSGAQTISARP